MHISLELLPMAMSPFHMPMGAQIVVPLNRPARRHPGQKFHERVTSVGARRYDVTRKTRQELRRALTAQEVDLIALLADSH
jgi:hypothetical protein